MKALQNWIRTIKWFRVFLFFYKLNPGSINFRGRDNTLFANLSYSSHEYRRLGEGCSRWVAGHECGTESGAPGWALHDDGAARSGGHSVGRITADQVLLADPATRGALRPQPVALRSRATTTCNLPQRRTSSERGRVSLDISHEAIIYADSRLSADSCATRGFARHKIYAVFAAQASDFGGRFASLGRA